MEGAEVKEGSSRRLLTGSCERLRARLLAGRAWGTGESAVKMSTESDIWPPKMNIL